MQENAKPMQKKMIEMTKEIVLEKIKTAELLSEISNRGFISTKRDLIMDRTYKFPRKYKPYKIGIVSDCHLGSQYQQISLLHEAYDIMLTQGVKDVLFCGDMLEGSGKMHRDQMYEMFIVGSDKLCEYAIKHYPAREGMTTHCISGNHDLSIYNASGEDPIKRICEARSDLNYLGAWNATIEIGRLKYQLLHPDGGNAYARSYKQQKAIEQLPSGKKPNIQLIGHYHSQSVLPNYRGVFSIQLPCFQTQTPYLKRKSLNPEIGFVILEITPNAKGVDSIKAEFIPFHEPIDGDF